MEGLDLGSEVEGLKNMIEKQRGQLALALSILMSLGFELVDLLDLFSL